MSLLLECLFWHSVMRVHEVRKYLPEQGSGNVTRFRPSIRASCPKKCGFDRQTSENQRQRWFR